MTYTQLLNTALELLDEQGPQQAFDFMQQQSPNIEYANPAQLYNFSYCLAALCRSIHRGTAAGVRQGLLGGAQHQSGAEQRHFGK